MIWAVVGLVMLAGTATAQVVPQGGTVTAGAASIAGTAGAVQINQASQNAIINWQSFSIGKGGSVTFVQPNSSAEVLNRVVGGDPSTILGSLVANGKVFLLNPNGVLFAKGASVNVGGLVASTLGISNANFMAGHYQLIGASDGAVINQGTISANGGYVALLGAKVDNEGVIVAQMGSIVLASGTAMTLDVAGNGLLNVVVSQGAVQAEVKNGGLIRANGGEVVMTAQAAGQMLKSVVNNTGIIEAETVDTQAGTIKLLGDMQSGTVDVGGTLDASAPRGGDGGTIETSAATVNVAPQAKVTTSARTGKTGSWTIDPVDFTVGAGGNISGATLSALLVTSSVDISTLPTAATGTIGGTPPVSEMTSTSPGSGDIDIDQAVSWTASPSTTTLTLNALNDINLNAPISATNGNLVACCGRDVNVNAAVTTVNGSMLLSAGRNVDLNSVGALTATDGDITLCAGLNINVDGAITLTRGTAVPTQSLGLAEGLVLIAGNGGTGPGASGGTLIFGPLTPKVTVTGPDAPVSIDYNPTSYTAPTDYTPNFTLSGGAAVTEKMLVFPSASKVYDGTTTALLNGFNTTATSGAPTGVTLVADPGATAVYDTSAVGSAIGITLTDYSLTGVNAAAYALADNCCVVGARTSGEITAVPPVVTPPVVTPPIVTPPVVTSPVVTPPVVTPPVAPPPVVTPVTTPVLAPVLTPAPPISTPIAAPVSVPIVIPTAILADTPATTLTPTLIVSPALTPALIPLLAPAVAPAPSPTPITANIAALAPSVVIATLPSLTQAQSAQTAFAISQGEFAPAFPLVVVPLGPVLAQNAGASALTMRNGGLRVPATPAPSAVPVAAVTPAPIAGVYPPKQDRF